MQRHHRNWLIALLGIVLWPVVGSTATKPPEADSIVLTASDSVKVAGFWFDCYEDGAPAVLLLHDHGRDHFAWGSLWPPLQRFGFHVLALDLRGHGASRELAPEKYEMVVRRDATVFREMVLDAQAGIRYLEREKKIRPERIVVIGGELGCGVGLALMAAEPRLRGMVALGPGKFEYGFQTLDLVPKYGQRPMLIFSSKEALDRGPQALADALKSQKAPVKLEVFVGSPWRGTAMLNQPIMAEKTIIQWLQELFPSGR